MLPLCAKMEKRVISKRKTPNSQKINYDITPAKLQKKELSIEKLTKLKIIEKYNKMEEEYQKVVSLNKELEAETKVLRQTVCELTAQSSNPSEVKTIETQTVNLLDEVEYPCTTCIYVADIPEELGWHNRGEHGIGNPDYEFNYSCRICRKPFDVKDDLMFHVKHNHEKNMPYCKYYQSGNCHFSDEKCWYKHKQKDQSISTFKCGYCGMEFKEKDKFMIHRKENHTECVKICIDYKNEKCNFKEKCWYIHKDNNLLTFN